MVAVNNVFSFMLLFSMFYSSYSQYYGQPEQIHLSYGDDPTEMVVTWVSLNATNISIVEYGISDLGLKASGQQDTFIDGGSELRKIYIHRVKLQYLKSGLQYMYHVGGPEGWSEVFYFTSMSDSPTWSPTLAVYGDMGNYHGVSIPMLQEEAQKGKIDAILHVGDFAYDLDSDNAVVGDAFMNQIEPIAAYVPYMTCVGNHEYAYNFSNYKARFTMPKAGGDGQNMFYSFNIGPAHIIAISTEFYFFPELGWAQMINQYAWLIQDLKDANKPENRAKRPWIIVMGHKPMYCSNNDEPDLCTNPDNVVRIGRPDVLKFGLEDLFYKEGVDLQLYAHMHSYERMWPVYNRTVCNSSSGNPYTNPNAPVHIVTGSAGNKEPQDPFIPSGLPWSAFHSDDFGYTRMVINTGTITLEQISTDQGGKVIDSVTITKSEHGPGLYNCTQTN